MKRLLAFVLALSFLFMLTGCNREEKAKEDISRLLEENYDAILKACEERNGGALLAIDGITDVNWASGYVIVYCKGGGIAPSSQDYGFYYSEKNSPVAIDCTLSILCRADDLTPEKNGYQYVDEYHNIFYTEHIKGNFYFYSTYY